MHEIEPSTNPFEAIRRMDHEGEHWTAREIVSPLGYTWRGFVDAIERARTALRVNGQDPDIHIRSWKAPSNGWSASGRAETRTDYRLTREGVYAIIQGGDPRKPEIAAGWAYFRAKTREAEVMIPRQREPEVIGDELTALEVQAQKTLQAIAIAKEERAARQLAEHELGIVRPKAEAWNTLASAHGDYSVADAAKILSRDPYIKLGERRLFTLLGDLGWTFRAGDGRWRIKQDVLEKTHRLSELPSSHYHPRTGELQLDAPQVRITVKGIEDLRNILISRMGPHQPTLELPS
jgi:DNA-damage-inducible protein D